MCGLLLYLNSDSKVIQSVDEVSIIVLSDMLAIILVKS